MEGYRERLLLDKSKEKYLKENNITLVRIPYTITNEKDLKIYLDNYDYSIEEFNVYRDKYKNIQ